MSIATVHPCERGLTRCTRSTGPTRQVHDSPGRFAVIRAGIGTTPSSRAAPNDPSRTSGEPSPQAPRMWGAQAGHASGRESSAQAASGVALESAVHVRMSRAYPGTTRPMGDVPEEAREWLEAMLLIRRFEERAGEMYSKAEVGGFLHLAIGEEATIIGAVRAMRAEDYLISTYRSHGHALARGTDPKNVMAELFGKATGVSGGRGGSMHMFDGERRFMGGYGIVGGNLPLAAGIALSSDYRETDEVTVCVFGDGAVNQGTFGETLNLAALWHLPIVFMVTNNQFGMGTSLARHSAQTDLHKRGDGFGVPGLRCDGMDVVDTYEVMSEAIERVRNERSPLLVEALTYRFRGHSMADPEEYRDKEQVEEWRKKDPIPAYAERLELSEDEVTKLDEAAIGRIDEAVAFAEESDFPSDESIYDHVYVP
jgi:pyruvate dehydrogenase E1 component alpha subunit